MSVRRRGDSWMIDINISRKKKRVYKSLPVSEYSLEEVVIIEQNMRAKLTKAKPTKMLTVGALVIPYLKWVDLHQSPITYRDKKRRLYATIVPFFGNYLWDQVDNESVQAFKEKRKKEIKEKGSKGGNREINLEILCLTAMASWGAKNGYLAEGVKLEKLPYTAAMPIILTKDEIKRFIESFSPFYRALFLCMYQAGMRRAEVFNLTWDRIDMDSGYVVVTGKGDKTRGVPMFPTLKSALQSILRPSGLVFPSPVTGNAFTDVRKAIARAKKAAGIEKRITPHLLRHCFGTYMLEGSGDIQAVGDLLGHNDLKTTKIYTHLSSNYLRKVVLKGLEEE